MRKLIFIIMIMIAGCSSSSTVERIWSPDRKNMIEVESSMYGGGYGGHEYDVRIVEGNSSSEVFSGTSPKKLGILWKDDYSIIVVVCGGNVKNLVSNHVIEKSVNTNDFDHIAFYTQPVTMAGLEFNGRSICE